MTFEADHTNLLISEALVSAKRRGLDVSVKVDSFVNMATSDVPNQLIGIMRSDGGRREFQKEMTQKMLKEFIDEGIDFEITNPPGIFGNLELGYHRNHKKMFIVDDSLYMGGLNLSQSVFEREDFVMRIQDPEIVSQAALIFKSKENDTGKNVEISCGTDTKFLIDGGSRESLILNKAIELINNSTSRIDFMSKHSPSGEIKSAMIKAKSRGVKIRTYSSKQDNFGGVESYAPDRGNAHAKLLIVDDSAIFGSHNFDWLLVALRTEEVSLLTTRREMVEPLKAYFEDAVLRTKKLQN